MKPATRGKYAGASVGTVGPSGWCCLAALGATRDALAWRVDAEAASRFGSSHFFNCPTRLSYELHFIRLPCKQLPTLLLDFASPDQAAPTPKCRQDRCKHFDRASDQSNQRVRVYLLDWVGLHTKSRGPPHESTCKH
jgi:hypothetical protein